MDSSPTSRTPSRAVVLGAGLTGLLAARVLAARGCDVVVVERDRLDGPVRAGVPQTPHTHGLLAAGVEGLEVLLPGLVDELVEGGAQTGPMEDVVWRIGGHRLALRDTGLRGLGVAREALETAVRERVLVLDGVALRDGCSVERPVVRGGRVVGVRVQDVGATVAEELPADLVVDALGRGSRTPRWAHDLGLPEPPQEEVRVDVRYVTRLMRRVPDQVAGANGEVVGTAPPSTRAGVVLAIRDDVWTVTLVGYFGDEPPSDLDGFRAYARTLGGVIAEIAEGSEPLGDPVPYRYPTSRWRHYEKVPPPPGMLVLGDAVCSLNPAFGQGISSAVQQVLALDARLASGADPDALQRDVQRDAARIAGVPWSLAVGVDRQFPQLGRKPLPQRVLDRYLERVLTVGEHDPAVAGAFLRVVNLLEPPPSVMAPAVVRRVVPRQRRAPVPAAP
ncbi:FAD-binding monooxygenase [Angustibacter speluncae]